MEIDVSDDLRMVAIWLTNAEKNDPQVREGLKRVYDQYKKKKFMVAVYESGSRDLYGCTRDLLVYNKRRIAELDVQREKWQTVAVMGESFGPAG